MVYFSGDVYSLQQTTDIPLSGRPTVPPVQLCHQSPGHSGGNKQTKKEREGSLLKLFPPAGSAHQPQPGAGVSLSPRSLHQRLLDGLLHH